MHSKFTPIRIPSAEVPASGHCRQIRKPRSSDKAPLHKSHRGLERPPFQCIALVLQGGGALGAFQAGVYEALVEADMQPDWVSGISIGGINAAIGYGIGVLLGKALYRFVLRRRRR